MSDRIATEDIVEKNAAGQTVVLVHKGQRIPDSFEYPAEAAAPAPAAVGLADFSLEALGDEYISRFAAAVDQASDDEKEAVAAFYANIGTELIAKGVIEAPSIEAQVDYAPDYGAHDKTDLEKLIEARVVALQPEGTGSGGKIVKDDLVTALEKADAVTLPQAD